MDQVIGCQALKCLGPQLGRCHILGPGLLLSADHSQPQLLGCDPLHHQLEQKCLGMKHLSSNLCSTGGTVGVQGSSPSQCWVLKKGVIWYY